mmetsp:Transcript_87946/g.174565  ORF Transcript_87946/g.174565 Transcript_87946/m.174565 type:complete len:692 (+) Transcript_87946:69-2144(+)
MRACQALLQFLWLAAVVGATKTRAPSDQLAQEQVSPVKMMQSLLGELRTQADAGVRYSGLMAGWCRNAKANKLAYSMVLQRQLDAANSATKQLTLEEQRLGSEQRLVQFTIAQKQQQLSDAEATMNFATQESEMEQHQMVDSLDSIKNALHLTQDSNAAKGPLANSLAQLPADQMTEGERQKTSSFMHDLGVSTAAVDAQDLSGLLNQMQLRLAKEKGEALQQHQASLQKFKTFASNLNSTILQTQSRMAAIAVEMAQRRRERARLGGRASDLTILLNAVQAGMDVKDEACGKEEAQIRSLTQFIAAESGSVKVVYKQLPKFTSASYTAPGAAENNGVLPFSFLQTGTAVKAHTAEPHAVESEDSDDFQADAAENNSTSSGGAMHELESFVKLDIPTLQDASDSNNNAMQDLRQFVSNSPGGGSSSGHRLTAKSTKETDQLTLMRNTYQQERARASQRLAKRRESCALIAREGKKDAVALSRSGLRSAAEVKINKETLAEYADAAAYNTKQKRFMDGQFERLTALLQGAQQETDRSRNALKIHSSQVLTAATELSQQLEAEQQGAARVLQELASRLESHQDALEQRSTHLSEFRTAVEAADEKVAQHLERNMETDKSRLVRLKYQGQYLSTLAQARQMDKQLSQQFEELTMQLCSEERTSRIGQWLANNNAAANPSTNLRAGRRLAMISAK